MIESINLVMESQNAIILDAFMKARSVLEQHNVACVSISGGSDSDVMLDLIERVRVGAGCEIIYVWFDTGFEYAATKRHLTYLEERYGIEIARVKAEKSVPTCVKQYGQPFISKYVSRQINALQKYGFNWRDDKYEELIEKYSGCQAAIKWWTNKWSGRERPGWYDIGHVPKLKEFMMLKTPWFPISDKCCHYSKKRVSKQVNVKFGADVDIIGVRKAEGGVRSFSKVWNESCYTEGDVAHYRPLFWFSDDDKSLYEQLFNIQHSECYRIWGFNRTGCAGCPFSKDVLQEIAVAEVYEPNIVKAARRMYRDSYIYTREYQEFKATGAWTGTYGN